MIHRNCEYEIHCSISKSAYEEAFSAKGKIANRFKLHYVINLNNKLKPVDTHYFATIILRDSDENKHKNNFKNRLVLNNISTIQKMLHEDTEAYDMRFKVEIPKFEDPIFLDTGERCQFEYYEMHCDITHSPYALGFFIENNWLLSYSEKFDYNNVENGHYIATFRSQSYEQMMKAYYMVKQKSFVRRIVQETCIYDSNPDFDKLWFDERSSVYEA